MWGLWNLWGLWRLWDLRDLWVLRNLRGFCHTQVWKARK